MPQVYYFFSKRLTFALSKPCASMLTYLCNKHYSPSWEYIISLTSLWFYPPPPCKFPYLPFLKFKCMKEAAKLLFSGAFEILLLAQVTSLAQVNSYRNSLYVWTFFTSTHITKYWYLQYIHLKYNVYHIVPQTHGVVNIKYNMFSFLYVKHTSIKCLRK